LLAEGIVSARERGLERIDEQLAAVSDSFTSAGVNLDVPYLNPGSKDSYTWVG
jgi:hypothetical protein